MMTLTHEAALEQKVEHELFTSSQKSKLIIKADALRDALHRIQSGLSSKTTVPIMQGIYMHAWSDVIRLRTANGNFFAETEIKSEDFRIENGPEAAIVFPGKKFIDLINKVSGNSITMDFNGLDTNIKCGGIKASLVGQHHAMYPDFPAFQEENSFEMPAGALLSMYRKTGYAVAVSENMPILMGISHEIKDGQFRCLATDKYRFARIYHEVDIEVEDISQTIPAITIAEVSKHLKTATSVRISFGSKMVVYKTEDVTIYSSTIDGTYPPTDRLIQPNYSTSFQISVGDLKKIIDRVSIYADDAGASLAFMQLRPDEKQLRFTSLQSEFGKLLEDVRPSKAEGSDLVISSNVRYMMDAIKSYKDNEVLKLSFNGFGAYIMQQVGGNENNVDLIVPVKNGTMPQTAEIPDFTIVTPDANPFEERASSYAETADFETN